MSVQIYIYSLMISQKMKPVQCALSYLDAEDVKNNDELMIMETRDNRIRRLIYQSSYTGTRETDLLLGQFANKYLITLEDQQLDDYEALLAQGDQNILAWVRGDLKIPANLDGTVFSLVKDFNATF